MSKTISSKEKMIFEAVNALAREGKHIHDITVSQIAAKAGIGKGTLYEYFATKDEILAKAVAFRILNEGMEIEEQAARQDSLREKFYTIVDCVYNSAREHMITCMITWSALAADVGIEGVWQYAPESLKEFRDLRGSVLADLAQAAKKEGLQAASGEYGEMALMSAMMGALAGALSGMQTIEKSKETAYRMLWNALKRDDEQDGRAI